MLREDIIMHLRSVNTLSNYDVIQDFFGAIEFNDEAVYEQTKILKWMEGCIRSLFYSPNKYCLILVGEQGIGKSEFLRYLSARKNWYGEFASLSQAQNLSRDFFILCVGNELEKYSKVKQMRSLCMNQEFVILNEFTNEPVAEKRLASYCASMQEWNHPEAKTDLIIKIKSIDFKKLNAIDRNLLWATLFKMFKPAKRVLA